MKTNEEILGMLHRMFSLTRRGIRPCPPPPRPEDASQTPPQHHHHDHDCNSLSFRERGRLLVELERQDGLTQRALAEILNIRPQSLSELVFKLEQDGLVERRMDETDKRAVQVFLSQTGRDRIEHIKQERRRFADEFLAPLNDEEREQLANLLEKLIAPHDCKK